MKIHTETQGKSSGLAHPAVRLHCDTSALYVGIWERHPEVTHPGILLAWLNQHVTYCPWPCVKQRKTQGHRLTAWVQKELPPLRESSRVYFFNPLMMPTFKLVHVHGDLSNLMVFMDPCIFKGFIYFFIWPLSIDKKYFLLICRKMK